MADAVEEALVNLYRAWASGAGGELLPEASPLTLVDPALQQRLLREFERRGLATRDRDPERWRILPGGIALVERLLPASDPDVVASRSNRNRILGTLVDPSGSACLSLSGRALEQRTGLSDGDIERTCRLLKEWHLVEESEAGLWSITATGRAIRKG